MDVKYIISQPIISANAVFSDKLVSLAKLIIIFNNDDLVS